MGKHIALLLVAQAIASTSVIMIKGSTIDPILLAGLRQILAAVILLPFYRANLIKEKITFSLHSIGPSVLPGIFLAVHFMTWNISARLTLAANATLLVNMAPVAMPFVIFVITREIISRREIVATLVAVVGVFVLAAGNATVSREYFVGDLISFTSMFFLTCYLALARRTRTTMSILLYVVPLYAVGGVICIITAAFTMNPFTLQMSTTDVAAIVGLAIGPTIIGHSVTNRAMGVVSSQTVSLAQTTQVAWATIMAFLAFGEVPGINFFPAVALIIGGILIVLLKPKQRKELF